MTNKAFAAFVVTVWALAACTPPLETPQPPEEPAQTPTSAVTVTALPSPTVVQIATSSPEPSLPPATDTQVAATATSPPTETPQPDVTYLTYDTKYGPEVEAILIRSGVPVTDSAVLFPGLVIMFGEPGGKRELEEIDSALLVALGPFTRADGTLDFPEEVTSFTWQYRWDQETGIMVPQVFFETEDGGAYMLDKSGILIQADIVHTDEGDVLVPGLENGRVVKVTPNFIGPTSPPTIHSTNLPPAQRTEAPPVVAPAELLSADPPTEPVLGAWYFDTARNKWVCQGCAFDINLTYTNPRNLAYLAYDYATQTIIEQKEFLTPGQFIAEYDRLLAEGYKPAFMSMIQNPGDGDPRDGVDKLNLAIYTMHINNPDLP